MPDVSMSRHPNASTQWDGNARFPPRDFMGTPIRKGRGDFELKATKQKIGMMRIPKANLNSIATKTVERVVRELKQYAGKPTEDQLLAMACNPFLAC